MDMDPGSMPRPSDDQEYQMAQFDKDRNYLHPSRMAAMMTEAAREECDTCHERNCQCEEGTCFCPWCTLNLGPVGPEDQQVIDSLPTASTRIPTASAPIPGNLEWDPLGDGKTPEEAIHEEPHEELESHKQMDSEEEYWKRRSGKMYRERRQKELEEWRTSWAVCVECGEDNGWNHKHAPTRHEDKLCKECYLKTEPDKEKEDSGPLPCLKPCAACSGYSTAGPVKACLGSCGKEKGHDGMPWPTACICDVCKKRIPPQKEHPLPPSSSGGPVHQARGLIHSHLTFFVGGSSSSGPRPPTPPTEPQADRCEAAARTKW